MANFPSSLDNGTSLPNPAGTDKQNSPDHGALHTNENVAIIALENKVGTGASTPTANTLLFGTGSGTSAWSALTSLQLAASLSDETGTGAAVFANTPTLVTPKIDTINENTTGNGVTVGGVNLKSGVIQGTPLAANSVTTANLQANSVTGSKIASYGYNTQAASVNTTQTALIIKEGWGYVNPGSGTTVNLAIVFPGAFPNSVVQIQHGTLGARITSVPTAVTDFNIGIGGEILQTSISVAATVTGMTLSVYKNVAFSSTSTYYGIWWRVIGT